ncbi:MULTISPECIES: hypothetical protein [unclassified Streptomyces]|nr:MULTISPECIES: hypothetical protein [unclassified Streptomyces]
MRGCATKPVTVVARNKVATAEIRTELRERVSEPRDGKRSCVR